MIKHLPHALQWTKDLRVNVLEMSKVEKSQDEFLATFQSATVSLQYVAKAIGMDLTSFKQAVSVVEARAVSPDGKYMEGIVVAAMRDVLKHSRELGTVLGGLRNGELAGERVFYQALQGIAEDFRKIAKAVGITRVQPFDTIISEFLTRQELLEDSYLEQEGEAAIQGPLEQPEPLERMAGQRIARAVHQALSIIPTNPIYGAAILDKLISALDR